MRILKAHKEVFLEAADLMAETQCQYACNALQLAAKRLGIPRALYCECEQIFQSFYLRDSDYFKHGVYWGLDINLHSSAARAQVTEYRVSALLFLLHQTSTPSDA